MPVALRLLLIKHSRHWDIDRVNRWAEARGHDIARCYPCDGEPLPDPRRFDAVVIFGGPASANDCPGLAWMQAELALIETTLHEGIAFFGICLGAQLLAQALGAQVSRPAHGRSEIGFVELEAVEAGFLPAANRRLFQWHHEGFELPVGATLLARSADFPQQAFRYGERHLGVQFHPEVNPAALAIWHGRLPPGKYPWLDDAVKAEQMAENTATDAAISDWLWAVLDRLVSPCHSATAR